MTEEEFSILANAYRRRQRPRRRLNVLQAAILASAVGLAALYAAWVGIIWTVGRLLG